MIFPAKLEQGDVIGLVAPSSPVDSDRIDECIVLLQNMGYRVKEGASCRKTYHGYLAGRDEERAKDINDMFADKDVKAIFCLRGGNGSVRIMDLLDYEMIKQNPKIFVGYSDITNLLMAFNTLCGTPCFLRRALISSEDSIFSYMFCECFSILKLAPFKFVIFVHNFF